MQTRPLPVLAQDEQRRPPQPAAPRGPWSARALAILAAFLAPAGVAALARLANGPLTVDDAFITFRYAENLRRGHGLVYNPGETVLGTTTPLYAALLACLPLEPGQLPGTSLWLNAALDGLVCLLLAWIGARLSGSLWAGALAATGYGLAAMSIAFSAGGMETPLFVLLALCSFSLWLRDQRRTALLASALATLTRPEGTLVAGLLLLDFARRERRLPWSLAAVYAGALLPWVAYSAVVYGSPVPHSVSAKAGTYSVDPWLNLAALLFGAGLPGFSVLALAEGPFQGPLALAVAAPALVALYALGRAGGRLALTRTRAALPLLLFAPLYAILYALAGLRGVRMFHWYLVPLVPFYALYLALGAAALARAAGSNAQRAIPLLAGALLVVWDLAALGISRGRLDRPSYPVGFSLERERLYQEVGISLRSAVGPDDVVAAPEIGALGYYSGARILDTVGLVSEGVQRYYPLPSEMLVADNAVPPQLIQDRKPRYVVALDQFIRKSLLQSDWFLQHYDLVERRPAAIWLSQELLVFRRNGSR